MGIFLVFLLANAAKIQQVQGDENNQTHLQPYLDEAGNLCQDKLETIQDTEYETMIQCRVAMKKTCTNQQIDKEDNLEEQQHPNEACHTVYDKNCKTVYRPHRSKVRLIRSVHVKKTKFEFTKFFSWFFFSFKFGFFFSEKKPNLQIFEFVFFSSEKIQIYRRKKNKFEFVFFFRKKIQI